MKTLLLILALSGATLTTSYLSGKNEMRLHPDLPNDGVITVAAGDMGEYKIDTRFNLCFMVNMNSSVSISCDPFNNLYGNE